ncbi:MFS transporter [Streptococcus sciuri]|uniref:MFS transporter n=1 Tax=Streptococcus sciuri TaxID=2973939 RepID=A0ABT2F5X4_9STRE|nr:MFS transporter [Streptococcus sciuri]MCS4487876.1 MFS transporter [Streptococcus sciuri]
MIKKQIFHYLLATFLVTVAYTLPHSILTVLLLKKGLSIPQILLIQSAYSLAIILFEFPSGMLSDNWSRKYLYLSSRFLLILMFLIVLTASNFYFLYLAWFIYGIAAAFESGTLDSYLINALKLSANDKLIESFISKDNKIQFISMIIGSGMGGILYFMIGIKIYIIAIVLVCLSIFDIGFFFKEDRNNHKEKINLDTFKKQLSISFKELRENSVLRVIIIFDLLTQLFFQAHFQLWQPFLLEKGIDKQYFTYFYFLFQIISILSYSIHTEKLQKCIRYRACFLLVLTLPIFFFSKLPPVYLIAYILYVFIFYIIQFVLTIYFNKQVSTKTISSLISLKSTISRIGGLFILYALSFLLNYTTVSLVVSSVFIASLLSILLLLNHFLRVEKHF